MIQEVQEFQYPNGWYMATGQIYSSPYEPYHVRITKMEYENVDQGKFGNYIIYYIKLDPQNYDEYFFEYDEFSSEEEYAYAWYFNEGMWDLEEDVA